MKHKTLWHTCHLSKSIKITKRHMKSHWQSFWLKRSTNQSDWPLSILSKLCRILRVGHFDPHWNVETHNIFWPSHQILLNEKSLQFHIPQSEMDRLTRADSQETQKRILETFAKDLPITNRSVHWLTMYHFSVTNTYQSICRTITGSVRFCFKCMLIKPDRAHHCSVCGTCVLKVDILSSGSLWSVIEILFCQQMDHHCPWVNSCVNFGNYKFFILFLGYALLYCLYISLSSLKYFILFWEVSVHRTTRTDLSIWI